ncbi:MAG: hypothetical protein R2741_11950 [Methanolobus sp.]
MTNIWTQHLEKTDVQERDKDVTFTRMLHSLVKTDSAVHNSAEQLIIMDNNSSDNLSYTIEQEPDSRDNDQRLLLNDEGVSIDYSVETEIIAWEAKSQKGHELGIESLDKDHVRLLMTEGGRLFLKYDVAGENPFEMTVNSEDEAMQIIEEDNQTTEQLYPDNRNLNGLKYY